MRFRLGAGEREVEPFNVRSTRGEQQAGWVEKRLDISSAALYYVSRRSPHAA